MKLTKPADIAYPKDTCYSVINGTNEKLDTRPESKIAIYDQAAKSMRFYHFQDGFCKTPKSPTASQDQYNTSVVQCDVCTRLTAPTVMSSMVTGCADAAFRILTYTNADCAAGTEVKENYKFYDGKDESARGLQRVVMIPTFAWPVGFCYTWTAGMDGLLLYFFGDHCIESAHNLQCCRVLAQIHIFISRVCSHYIKDMFI
jgi:hypothetical protein